MRSGVLRFFLIVSLLLPTFLMGQVSRSLTTRMEETFKLLRPADRKELVEGYVSALNSALLRPEEKRLIDSLFVVLQDLHVTVSPELRNYVACVNYFCKRGERENLLVWLEEFGKVLNAEDRKRMLVKSYLETTVSLACHQLLFDGESHQWLVRGKMVWSGGDSLMVCFADADLICKTRKDSVIIRGTAGEMLIGTDRLEARGGTVKWNDPADQMKVELQGYTVNLKVSNYTADSVWFHYEARYEHPVLGRFKDNALKYTRTKNTPFPEFYSYSTDIWLREIFKDISFRGGIAYAGTKFTGIGTEERPALLEIVPDDSIRMNLYSRQFTFDSLRIMAGHSAMEMLLDSGAITHSDINFLYMGEHHTVVIKRISDQSLHLPFKDSYHQILFDMEEIFWPLDSIYLEMRMSSRSGMFKATIESMNFFSDNVYDNIQGLDEINPLNGLLKCSLQCKSNTFTVTDYAAFMKKSADQLRKQIILLSYNDFVDYNESRDEVVLKPRLFDYTKARVGKQDYDNIRFTSQPGKSRVNAVMDTRNFNLRIIGVDNFVISEARNVSVEPSDRQVVMMKNRDMEFNGKLKAGMFDMYGNNLFFSYDNYSVTMPKVDSTGMYLAGRDNKVRGRKVKSLIRDISGDIVIDRPNNKSGKKENPEYPQLNSRKESFVYFDAPEIQQGRYKRDSFYYKIKPYQITGINDASKIRYAFDGTLVSNIVAPIHDTLRLLEDNALGVSYQTPDKGIELYGKGRIYSHITLNRQGFKAKGKVDLNRSIFNSDTILMLPDEMLAHTREIQVKAVEKKRPGVQGKEVEVKYLPALGNLQATSTALPFSAYEGRVTHDGTLFIYEDLLDASGKLEIEGASLRSRLFNLQAEHILSPHTSMNIASVLNQSIQLNTSNVKAEIDLVANKGKFVNNAADNRAEFASSRYTCTFESFTWYMKEAYLNIGVEDPVLQSRLWKIEDPDHLPRAARNMFVSTNRLLDSLHFIVPAARYDLKNGDIDCHWVNHIEVANGRFYPEKGDIHIASNGDIREFQGGRLLCERTDSTRVLRNVQLKLVGRNKFSGAGDYTYVSEEKKESVVRFTEIGADTAKLIYARALLKEEEPLLLNDGLVFKGKITLFSRKADLYYDGYTDLTTEKKYLSHTWVTVKDHLRASHIRIPLKVENRSDKQQRIYNGIYLGTDKTFKPYAAFLSKRLFYSDDLLAAGEGWLEWSKGMRQYIISDTVRNKYYRFRYDPETSVVSSYGPVMLDMKIPGLTQKMAGDISFSLEKERLDIRDVLYLIDFAILGKMEGILQKDFAGRKMKNITVTAKLREKIYEVCGKQSFYLAEKQLRNISGNVPDSLSHLFVLDSLNFIWNEQTRSYMASGPANVIAMKGRPVEKTMKVKMELLRSRSGNQYFMYIYDDNLWYYFEFSDKNLYTLSSNEEYNTVVKTEKAEKKLVQNKEKETLYTITLCPESKKERFLKRIK